MKMDFRVVGDSAARQQNHVPDKRTTPSVRFWMMDLKHRKQKEVQDRLMAMIMEKPEHKPRVSPR